MVLWIASAILILFEQRIVRMILYFSVFSLFSAVVFLLLGAPDVAMAEAAIASFVTIFFLSCFEKYSHFDNTEPAFSGFSAASARRWLKKSILPFGFVCVLAVLFFLSVPTDTPNTYLKYQYTTRFYTDVGGINAVTAIYLGYRVYDTLFEALILLVGVLAVAHMSYHSEEHVDDGKHSNIERYKVAVIPIKIIAPLLLVFGIYLTANGAFSPGGGFQGGVIIASFFVCRYMIYDLYDIPVEAIAIGKKIVFIALVASAAFVVFLGATLHLPMAQQPFIQTIYLVLMNLLIGTKVACGFIVLFYRYIAIEGK